MRRTRSPFILRPLLILLLTAFIFHSANSTPDAPSTASTTRTPPTLSSLTIARPASLTLSPPFSPTTYSYQLLSPTLLSAFSLVTVADAVVDVQLRLNDGPFFHMSPGEEEEVELLEGVNHVFLQSVNEDTRETVSYLVTVCNGVNCQSKPLADNPTTQLLSLVIPNVNLTPAFTPTTYTYAAHTTRHTHGVIVIPTLLQPAAKQQLVVSSLNGEIFTGIEPLQRSHAQPMRMGANYLFVQVRDEQQQLATYALVIERRADGGHQKTKEERSEEIEYIGGLAYIRIKEASAELTSLISSAGLLSPRFAPELRSYSLSVDHHTPTMAVTATTRDTEAKLSLAYTWSTSSSPQPTTMELETKVMSAPIKLCVGKTTVRVSVTSYDGKLAEVYSVVVHRESEAEEGMGELGTSPTLASKQPQHSTHHAKKKTEAHDDPQLVGVRGQKYTVHVEAGQVYNLITEPHLLANARYTELPQVDEKGRPTSQTVLGIAEIALKTRTGHQLYLQTGAGEREVVGFARVSLNQQVMNVEDQAQIDNAEESTHEDSSSPATHSNTELLAYNTSHTFSVLTPTWYLTFSDTPTGIRPAATLHTPPALAAHGLVGQTWRDKRGGRLHEHGGLGKGGVGVGGGGMGGWAEEGREGSMEVLEGSMEDYRVKDGALWSSLCEFNLYESEGAEILSED